MKLQLRSVTERHLATTLQDSCQLLVLPGRMFSHRTAGRKLGNPVEAEHDSVAIPNSIPV